MDTLNAYIYNLIKGDKRVCYSLIQNELQNYSTPFDLSNGIKNLYLNIFQPSMKKIGSLWESNEISVAQEHVATAITQHLMATLYPRLFDCQIEQSSIRVIITCPSGELHELPSRMLSDLLVLEGADVTFVGANTPTEDLIDLIEKEKPDKLILSCTITRHIPEVKKLITAIRDSEMKDVVIIVGGYAFDQNPLGYKSIGADYYGASFEESIRLIMNQEESCHVAI